MTALNSEGFLPCPFCGGGAKIEYFSSTSVECTTCDAVLEGAFSTPAEAISAWNRRALPPVDGLEVVGGTHLWVMEEIAASLLSGDRTAATKLRAAIDHFSQASSVIAGLTAERDEAKASAFVWENRFVLMDGAYNRELSRAQAAEARISSLEEENKRLREAIDAIADFDDPDDSLDPNVIHLIRIAGAARRAARQALEDHNG